MPPELTDLEQQFFATGELPEGLAPEAAAPPEQVDQNPASASAPDTNAQAPAVEPPPVDPTAELRSQLEAERARNNQVMAQIADLRESLSKLMPQQKGEPDNTPPEVNPNDPLGTIINQLQHVTKTVHTLDQRMTSTESQNQQAEAFNNFAGNIKALKDEFAKTTTDFGDAYQHLRKVRADDLRDMGVPETRINEVLLRDEVQLSMNAIQAGKNPAELIYGMAKRAGYAPKAAGTPPAQDAATKLANLNKGVNAAREPQRGGREGDLTLEGLKDAGNDDLNRLVQDDKLWHKLVGNTSHDIF